MNIRSFAAVFGAAAALAASSAPAGAQTLSAVYHPDATAMPKLEKVQYFYGGRQYCWYPGGWHGPGWYWCGYASRRGLGWGGIEGWRGWRHGGGWRGHDRGWHGHDRGWHGGHDRGGWHRH